jgi:hypothetical protein
MPRYVSATAALGHGGGLAVFESLSQLIRFASCELIIS